MIPLSIYNMSSFIVMKYPFKTGYVATISHLCKDPSYGGCIPMFCERSNFQRIEKRPRDDNASLGALYIVYARCLLLLIISNLNDNLVLCMIEYSMLEYTAA